MRDYATLELCLELKQFSSIFHTPEELLGEKNAEVVLLLKFLQDHLLT